MLQMPIVEHLEKNWSTTVVKEEHFSFLQTNAIKFGPPYFFAEGGGGGGGGLVHGI